MAELKRKRAGDRKSPALSVGAPVAAMFLGGAAANTLLGKGIAGPRKALDRAYEMGRAGAGRREIHAETSGMLKGTPYAGVTFGKDRKARFELSDAPAQVRPVVFGKGGKPLKLPQVLDHPHLYEALPSAKGITVGINVGSPHSTFDNMHIAVGDKYFDRGRIKPEAVGPLLHEIQHHAQDIHEFDPGGNPGMFKNISDPKKRAEEYRKIAGEQEAELTRNRSFLTAQQRRADYPVHDVPLKDQHLAADIDATGGPRQLLDFRRAGDAVKAAWQTLTSKASADNKPVHFRQIPVTKIKSDPEAFQFKSGGDKHGVTDRMKGVTKWDPVAAGKAIVFERADGSLYIADGHQRLGLGKRLTAEGQKNIALDAYVLRERDGWAPKDVRAYAALKNMKELSGSALDMAKVARERPDLLDGSLPLSDAKIREAMNLAKLSEPAFKMVVGGAIKPEHAAAVGEAVPNAARHADLMAEMVKAELQSTQQARLYVSQAMAAPSYTESMDSLFGAETQTRSLLKERVAVLDKAMTALRNDKRIFSLLEREANSIEGAGNKLAHAENAMRARSAGDMAALVEKLAQTKGQVSSMLDAAATAVAEGKTPAQAARAFVKGVGDTLKAGGINALTGENQGWSDAARAASAEARKGNAKKGNRAQPGLRMMIDDDGQGDMLPKATTAEKIAAEAKKLAEKGRTGDPATHGLFGSGMKQTDLVDQVKADPPAIGHNAPATPFRVLGVKDTPASEDPHGRGFRHIELEVDGRVSGFTVSSHEPLEKSLQTLREEYRASLAKAWDAAAERGDRLNIGGKEVDAGKFKGAVDTKRTVTVYAGKKKGYEKAAYPKNQISIAGETSAFKSTRVANIAKAVGMPTWAEVESQVRAGWSDQARAASAAVRKANSRSVSAAVERAIAASAAKAQQPSTLVTPVARADNPVDAAYKAHLDAIRDTASDPKTKATNVANTREALQQAQHDSRKAKRAEAKKKITDIGEKIGGARKDMAIKTGPRKTKPTIVDTRPAWERRYAVQEIVAGHKKGQWSLVDTGKTDWRGNPRVIQDFASEAAAREAIPVAAVSRNHLVRGNSDGKYEIWRKVTDRKSVKVVADSFASREEAMKHLAQNAQKIIETKTGFGEEILAKPEKVFRVGPEVRKGTIAGETFAKTFGFRGVEFGNWNSQVERQAVMNHAYEAMHDLSHLTGVDPKSLTLGNKIGLAFGARGHGLAGARAHYERDYRAINLTKMKGAGSLAHEWMHALDHYLGQIDDPKLAEEKINALGHKVVNAAGRGDDFASHRVTGYSKGHLNETVRAAYKDLIDTLYHKEERFTEDRAKVEKFAGATGEQIKSQLAEIRKHLAEPYQYSKKGQPATAAQLAKFDEIAAKITSGEAIKTELKRSENARSRYGGYRNTNDALEALSKIHKEVRGRAGWDSQHHHGPFDRLAQAMQRHEQRLKMVADSDAQTVKTRKVPTEFAMNAKRIDQGRATDYWTTRHEMAARAFSSYIEDKAAAAKMQSDFLSYGSDNKHYRGLGVKPFPEGSEREVINQKFDNLFKAMREAKLVEPAKGLAGWSDEARAKSAEVRTANAKAASKRMMVDEGPMAAQPTGPMTVQQMRAHLKSIGLSSTKASKAEMAIKIAKHHAGVGLLDEGRYSDPDPGARQRLARAADIERTILGSSKTSFKGRAQLRVTEENFYPKSMAEAHGSRAPATFKEKIVRDHQASGKSRKEALKAANADIKKSLKAAKGQGPWPPQTPGGPRGFQNETTLNAALKAQGKAAKGAAKLPSFNKLNAAAFNNDWKAFDAKIANKSPEQIKALAAAAEKQIEKARAKQARGEAGMGKDTSKYLDFSKMQKDGTAREWTYKQVADRLGKLSGKLGGKLGIAGIVAASAVAYDATKSEAAAAGATPTQANMEGAKAAALTGGVVAGIGYGITKGVQVLGPVIGGVAAKTLGPAALIGSAAYHAPEGYRKGGVLGGAVAAGKGMVDFTTMGAAPLAEKYLLPSKEKRVPYHAPRSAAFAKANATYGDMQKAEGQTTELRGWANPKVQAAAQAAKGNVYPAVGK